MCPAICIANQVTRLLTPFSLTGVTHAHQQQHY